MIYLLDTNTCIRYLNGQSPSIKERLQQLKPQDVVLCSVVKAELLYGAAKGTMRERTRTFLDSFFARFISLPFDDRAAEAYGAIRADLERKGAPLSALRI